MPAFILPLLLYLTVFRDLPDPYTLTQHRLQPSIRVEDRHGKLLYEAIDSAGGRNTPLPLSQIPNDFIQATILTEDKNFYSNPGVDIAGIIRALWIDLRGGEIIAGGSTITQQLTRNLLLADEQTERTLRRKLRESWLAWRITQIYDKDEILALYINQSYYGGMAYGVEAAAQTYFGKSATTLTLAESALIAGLPQAPGTYNPFVNPDSAKERQEVVLGLMAKADAISDEQFELAIREPLGYAGTPYPVHAPHFVMMVLQEVDKLYSPEQLIEQEGIIVQTTLDLAWQSEAERIINVQLDRLNHPLDGAESHNAHNSALVALDPQTGEVLTLVGNADYFDAENAGAVNMAISPRQPGSAIKPFIYSAAISPDIGTISGIWHPATMIPDVRTVFITAENEPYAPENFSRDESGPVLLRQALGSSLNIPAVATLQAVGLDNALDFVTSLGIQLAGDRERYGLSFALGGGEVRLIDLTSAFGVFANGGYGVTPSLIMEIRNGQGKLLFAPEKPTSTQLLDERVAWLISDILSDNEARMPAFGENSVLRLDRTAAVKTGTTNSFHDNWTMGYTPDLVVGVWVGNSNNEPMKQISGVSGAGPIWHQFMRTALADSPDKGFVQPSGLTEVEICQLSGMLPSSHCPFKKLEWFIAGTQPTQPDQIYQQIWLDPNSGTPVSADTPFAEPIIVLDLPPNFYDWARGRGVPLLADWQQAGVDWGHENSLYILSPDPNDRFFISPNLPLSAQRIPIRVAYAGNLSQLTIFLDGVSIATFTHAPYETWWELEAGEHMVRIEGVDNAGNPLPPVELQFTVVESE